MTNAKDIIMTVEQKVIAFAKKKHKGQKDDDGRDYFEAHLQHVVEILKTASADGFVIMAGYLHDCLEDTDTTYEELEREFGEKVAKLVNEVTHEGKKDNTGYYFPRLKTKDGILIKFADAMSNLTRMGTWNESRQAHHLKHSKFWRAFPGDKWLPKTVTPDCMKKLD